MAWLDGLSGTAITEAQGEAIDAALDALRSPADRSSFGAVELLQAGFQFDPDVGPSRAFGGPAAARVYWSQVCREFRKLVCTKDRKYAAVRRKVDSAGDSAATLIVGTVSAAVAGELGTTPGLLTPFCMLCLLCLAKVGKEAFCEIGAASDNAKAGRRRK
jgi:hypothetical protein